MASKAVVGVYSYLDDVLKTVKAAKDSGWEYEVFSPVPNHDLEHATSHKKSPIRFITLAGAVTGLVGGFTLAIMCSLDYPLRVSAKPIVSPPGFVVIGYECTILFGALITLASMFHFTKTPYIFRRAGYDPRFSDDKFGVVIGCEPETTAEIEEKLRELGAEEVEVQDGL